MQRFFIVFLGQVQGVGFRYTVYQLAQRYQLTGSVRNRVDGSVECELQGDYQNIKQLIAALHHASKYIKISDYSMKPIPLKENEKGFSVRSS